MLTRVCHGDLAVHTDPRLRDREGIVVAFSERTGGSSLPPYASLNLAGHVGDDPDAVNANRALLLDALGLAGSAGSLTCAEQVHKTRLVEVTRTLAGSGARVGAAAGPVPGADALWTRETGVPLMLFFADCVPVVLVSENPRAVAVVHAGWRGALAGIVGSAVRALHAQLGEDALLSAYVGPHIGECCYEVSSEILSQFATMFVTIPRASSRLDLAAVVAEDLVRAGVSRERQWHLGICTSHNTDRFYSYRAEGRTGRHAAFACLEQSSS